MFDEEKKNIDEEIKEERPDTGGEAEALDAGGETADGYVSAEPGAADAHADTEDLHAEEDRESREREQFRRIVEDTAEDDGLEFISLDSVRDRTKMVAAEDVTAEPGFRKKTKRRSADELEVKKSRSIGFIKKHPVIIIIIIAVIVAIICLAAAEVRKFKKNQVQDQAAKALSEQNYETDSHEEINELIEKYYSAYAAGDTAALSSVAYPISDTEISYIKMYAQYLDGYENIVCYTKAADEGAYLVSASYELKYAGVETPAPGLDFFYICTDGNGAVYINNTYGTFNLVRQENALDTDILAQIEAYEADDDVAALSEGVELRYNAALSEDESLRVMVEETIVSAISAWSEQTDGTAENAGEDVQADESKSADESTADDGEKSTETAEQADQSENTDQTEQTENDQAGQTEQSQEADESDEDEPSVTETESLAWVYTTAGVRLREEPSEDSDVLNSMEEGEKMRRLAVTDNGWTKVRDGEFEGYVKSEYISETQP